MERRIFWPKREEVTTQTNHIRVDSYVARLTVSPT
jgi:preprotein translocase subunit SecE